MTLHVFVTGASSGIGEAIAREFATVDGARLTIVARRKEKLDELAASLGAPTLVLAADLTDPDSALAALAAGEAEHGPVDVLVNNAGVQIVARTVDVDPVAGERLLALNVTTPFRLLMAVLPAMVARDAGSIVNVSSVAGLAPTPGMFHYNASKAALAAAGESLNGELRGTRVHVLTVYPGPVTTPMAESAISTYEGLESILRRLPTGDVATLARRIRKAVARRRKRLVYPRFYALTRWFPGTSRWIQDVFAPLPPPAGP